MKFSKVTERQMRLARLFEKYGICSYSKALKAFERREEDQIEKWKEELDRKTQEEE